MDALENLQQQFPPVNSEAWKAAIIRDLRTDAYDQLFWHSKEGIDVRPFYTAADVSGALLDIPVRSRKTWQILESIKVNKVEEANRRSLDALNMGADALLFDLGMRSYSSEEIRKLLDGILLEAVSVYFENYVPENKAMLEDWVPASCLLKVDILPAATLADELAQALRAGLALSRAQAASQIHFHFFTGTNYFFEIARLRAFRWLWKQVADLGSTSNPVFLISETLVQEAEGAELYTNMMRNTTEAMSAVLGGCDALIINSHEAGGDASSFGRRIARNIHHLLQQEAGFLWNDDPASGSYYVEYLSSALARKAWDKFRNAAD